MKGIVGSGAFVLGASLLPRPAMSAWDTGAGKMPGGTVNDPHVFVAIDPSGLVTIVTHRSEMGTGVRTSLPMVVADEMEADWSRVRVVQAPGDEKNYGNQDTDGSRSMRHFVQPMRAVRRGDAHDARAGGRQAVGRRRRRGARRRTTRSCTWPRASMLGYGELAKAARALPAPAADSLKLKDPRDFRYIGKGEIQIVDLHDITTGKATLWHRREVPGMKFAVIARPPVVGGKCLLRCRRRR